jgi:hypothetical protein
MTTLPEIQIRIAQVLEDPDGKRFSASLLAEAVRQALNTFDQRLPRLLSIEVPVASGGRDQLLTTIPGCLYLVNLTVLHGNRTRSELEPEGEFSYQFEGEQLRLHFSGTCFPKNGDVLRITYAANHQIEGLDGAEETTLPAGYESAMVIGAAGHACLLRATMLTEAYGSRPEETTRLLEISRLHLDEFGRTLGNLKVLQEFGFPPGFALDNWDQGKRF